MHTLVLSRIAFQARHGATEAEWETSRAFEVDVEIDADLARSCASDRLEDTIDYRAVAETIITVGTSGPHHLLEAVAGRMLDALVAKFPHATFRIELRKLNPPGCPGTPRSAAVRMSRLARQ